MALGILIAAGVQDEAYALGGTDQGVDSYASDAIRTLLTEVENNRTAVLVVLAGYKDKMTRLLNADPGLPRRFPLQLHLSDYTPEDLGKIAEQAANDRFEMRFAPGLQVLIVANIRQSRLHDIAKNNAALAINMVETAMGQLATRVMRQRKQSPGQQIEMDVLVAEDFGIDEAAAAAPAPAPRPAPSVDPARYNRNAQTPPGRTPSPAPQPKPSLGWLSSFGPELVGRHFGKSYAASSLATKKHVGVYFSAHWCPPCRSFTPVLASWYRQHAVRLGLEIVFVSSDQSESAFNEYIAEMPWVAVPYSASGVRQTLSDKYSCRGVPYLVILDQDGGVCTTEGRGGVSSDPTGALFPWGKPKATNSFREGQTVKENDPLIWVVSNLSLAILLSAISFVADSSIHPGSFRF